MTTRRAPPASGRRERRGPGAAGALAWLGALLWALGCSKPLGPLTASPRESSDPFPSSTDAGSAEAAAGSWPYVPRSIRVHPLTRRMPGAPVPTVEVHVECLDEEEETTRGIGMLEVELRYAGQRLGAGPLDLGDREVNRATFDRVTRTYRVVVQLPVDAAPAAQETLEVHAVLTTPQGAFSGHYRLVWTQ